MKALPFIMLMFLLGTLASPARIRQKKSLLLVCQGAEEFVRDNPRAEQVLLMREEVESLINEGNYPVVIECDRKVAWIFVNDPDNGRDYPEVNFKSDYFEMLDLFPLKINRTLKKRLKIGNKEFLETLGIKYLVKNGEVISEIDYDRFEKFMF